MCLHCRDPAMSVRKQVLQGLTNLLKAHGTEVPGLPEAWLSSVLPALQDPEVRICEFVLEVCILYRNMYTRRSEP
jgi:condensin-2 complex subunit D3